MAKRQYQVNVICPERTKTPMREDNFGEEDSKTLLDPKVVAEKSLQATFGTFSGLVIDVRI